MELTVPVEWEPRFYQLPSWLALEGGALRVIDIWHRRAGKDLFWINWTARCVPQRIGLYWHVFPTLKQGRKIAWEGMTREGRKFLDHFPGHRTVGEAGSFCTRKRDDEMTLWFANGSMYQVVGAENPDSLVGPNPVGIVFSEYAVYDSGRVWQLLRPILRENGGWAGWATTPRGRNQLFKLYNKANEAIERSASQGRKSVWFVSKLGVDDTGIVSEEAIQEERDEGMAEEMVQQEYYCSFDAPLVGSYYGDLLMRARDEGRIRNVPWEMGQPVQTWWDLGIRDATCIWFYQYVSGEHRLIDFYYATDVGLEHYAKKLGERPYVYSDHLVPHDAQQRLMSGEVAKTKVQMARELGLRMRVVPKIGLSDGIQETRKLLAKLYIDQEKCEQGIDGLGSYVRKKIEGEEDPDGNPIYSDVPAHTWASHPADALRTGAVGLRPRSVWDGKPLKRKVGVV